MNDFGLVQLIWIKRLVSETARINTLIECNRLSERDLNRYKSVISAIDDFCAFVINSQSWSDVKNISSIVDEVEMVLFQHFYEQIGAFEDEEVHLDLSGDDEVNLRFENPFIENQRFGVIDDNDLERVFDGSVLEGEIVEIPDEIEFEINDENPLLFFASPFWTKLQNIFGHCCMSKLDKVAKHMASLEQTSRTALQTL